jgi:two-component system response regulator HydG
MCQLLEVALRRLGHDPASVTSGSEALACLEDQDFDVIVTDIAMAEMDGLELCRRVAEVRPGLPVVVITGQGSMEAAVAALRAGAYDFVTKPVDEKLLAPCLARAGQARVLQREVQRLRKEVGGGRQLEDVVGASSAMRRVYDLVGRVAPSDASVLIHGETGTGKELIARSIHSRSLRKDGPFVAINCAAVPANLIESELFGHARGAFTDAKTSRAGLFVEANGGTLFLDEIGEMPLEVQPKLLRALQERKVRPVGSNAEVPFDARMVAATNRDLEAEVEDKRFREDLYYRINVVKIELPPLRERGTDVLAIAEYLLRRLAAGRSLSLSPQAAERLMAYDWPGNVRELENCMERAVALARFDQVTVEDLPEKVRTHRSDRLVVSAEDASELVTLDELERRDIQRVLKMLGGNKSRAARVLGLDRRTLYRKLDRQNGRTHSSSSAPAPLSSAPPTSGPSSPPTSGPSSPPTPPAASASPPGPAPADAQTPAR